MYHQLIKDSNPELHDRHSVYVEDFRKQMKIILQYGFTPITFADYQLYLEEKLTLPKKPIIITFDDGYLDTYETAIPILLELDIRAVIFVLGNRNLKQALWNKSGNGQNLLMSDEQIIEVHSLGFEIGAHSMNHLPLADLDDEEIRHEIAGSKASIEKVLNEQVLSISYPYGNINERVLRIAEECGFVYGCGVYTGPPVFGDNLHDLRRLAIKIDTSRLQFMMRLILPFQYIEWTYSRVKLHTYRFEIMKGYFRQLSTSEKV